jgi:Tetratricopeptide repeat
MKLQTRYRSSAAGSWSVRARLRPIMAWSALAGMLAQGSGCVTAPVRKDSDTIPPAAPPDAKGPSPSELAKASDPKSEFHKSATDRQRFQVHVDFGRIFEVKGDYDAAVLEYQDALTVLETKGRGEFKAADHVIAHRRMGAALDRLGRFAQADVHYKRALKYAPRDPKVWNDLGYSYYLQSRWAESERALRTALKYAPEDERVRTNLGLTLAAAGRADDAFPLLSQTGGDAIGHANLGYFLAAAGQLELARYHYQQALAQRPDLEVARRALAQLDRQQQLAANPPNPPTANPAAHVASGSRAPDAPVDPRLDRASTPNLPTLLQPPPLPGDRPLSVPGASAGASANVGSASLRPVIPPPRPWSGHPPELPPR